MEIINYGAFYRKLSITLCVFAVIVIYIIMRSYLKAKRARYIESLIYKHKNPQQFIIEIEKDLKKQKSEEIKRRYIITKTSAMVIIGLWEEVVEILNSFDPDILLKEWQVKYYYNMINSLFLLGRIKEALEMLSIIDEELFKEWLKKERDVTTIKTLYGMNYFYKNDLLQSEYEFKEVLNLQKSDTGKAFSCYYLALINKNKNNKEKTIEYIKMAKKYGENMFVEEEITKIENKYKE